MSDHCAYPKCGKELTHIEGRKKKKYCNQNCNTRHWQMLHPTYKPRHKMVKLETFDKLTELAKSTPLGQKIMEEISKKPLTFKVRDISSKGEVLREHEIKYSVADKNSFDGERINRAMLDEPGQWEEPKDKFELKYCDECIQMTNHKDGKCQKCILKRISQIEKDLCLPSKYLSALRKKQLQTELSELKSQLLKLS
jgi:hypothetical protein